MANIYRADQVGGLVTTGASGAAPAEAVRELLAMQKKCGIDIASDGQVLRTSPCSIFAEVSGIRVDPEGHSPRPYVAGPLERKARLTVAEVEILKSAATMPYKICLPAPTVAAVQLFREGITDAHYPTRRDLAAALAAILREEIADLIADGVAYIQLDGPAYELAADRAGAARLGGVDEMLRTDAEALKDLRKPTKVALALRVPRPREAGGTSQPPELSRRRAAVLESVLTGMPVDRFLIEFSPQPSEEDFAPLRAVPAGRMAVLGLVDPLAARADEIDPLLDRLDLAVNFTGPERLALSPRRGFADSGASDHAQAYQAQIRSLTLTVETARRFWGFET